MNNTQPTAAADGTPAGNTSLNLEAVLDRIADLDDQQLQDLVHGLDTDLKHCRDGLLDDTGADLVFVAAAARITLRRRQAAAGRRRATARIRQLFSTETTE